MDQEALNQQEAELLTILGQLSEQARRMLLGAARGLFRADAALAEASNPVCGSRSNLPTLH